MSRSKRRQNGNVLIPLLLMFLLFLGVCSFLFVRLQEVAAVKQQQPAAAAAPVAVQPPPVVVARPTPPVKTDVRPVSLPPQRDLVQERRIEELQHRLTELQTRLQAILGRELRMAPSSINLDAPFPELGLDSMMAMTVLKETKKLVGLDVSANMLFNHPTIASLATYVAGLLAPADEPEEDSGGSAAEPERSVLDDLFDSVEAASASSDASSSGSKKYWLETMSFAFSSPRARLA